MIKFFYYHFSQGFDVSGEGDFENHLTHLSMESGLTLKTLQIRGEGTYFYDGKHVYEAALNHSHPFINSELSVNYNSLDEDVVPSNVGFLFQLRPFDTWTFETHYDFALHSSGHRQASGHRQKYRIAYEPSHRCWKFELHSFHDTEETRVGMNFQLLWNSPSFGTL